MGQDYFRYVNKKEKADKRRADEKNQKYVDRYMLENLPDDLAFAEEQEEERLEAERIADAMERNAALEDEMMAARESALSEMNTEIIRLRELLRKKNRGWSLLVVLCFLMAAVLYLMIPVLNNANQELERYRSAEGQETVYETEALQDLYAETIETQNDSWKNVIFGNSDIPDVYPELEIYGLSDVTMKKLGVEETVLKKDASAFLTNEGIATDLICFEERIKSSSDQAVSYQASMAGVDDKMLEVIIYPDFPGEYIFLLSDKAERIVVKNHGTDNRTPEADGNVPEQIQAPSTQLVQEEPRVIRQTQEHVYDAERLSVSIPKELANYVGNTKALQYSLYNNIYQKGYKDVRSASVTDYSIDGDVRQASFTILLDNNVTVTGTYYLNSGSYSFS